MSDPELMPFQTEPFNGDKYVEQEFLKLKKTFNLHVAIETGSCCYGTTKFLSENFSKVISIELNPDNAKIGLKNILNKKNVLACLGNSEVVLENIVKNHIKKEDRCVFFLDSHWGENFPLLNELDVLSNLKVIQPPVIVIHDFCTWDNRLYYFVYNNIALDYNYITTSVEKLQNNFKVKYRFYFNEWSKTTGAKSGVIYLWPVLS